MIDRLSPLYALREEVISTLFGGGPVTDLKRNMPSFIFMAMKNGRELEIPENKVCWRRQNYGRHRCQPSRLPEVTGIGVSGITAKGSHRCDIKRRIG